MDQGLAPCEGLLRRHRMAPDREEVSWEVGRLVLAPQFRSGPESLKRFLFLTLVDLLEDAPVEYLFASCTPLLGRLYRRFGFSVVVKEASQGHHGSYSLIRGHVPEVLRALAASRDERAQVAGLLARRERIEALPC